MQKKTLEERYDAAVANIELNSPYKRINGESKYMTAAEMGKLLGLKKQNDIGCFINIILNGKNY